MAESSIEWTDVTWNPVSGCTRVSAGCDHCYAVRMTHRLENMGQKAKYGGLTVLNGKGERQFNGQVRTHEDALILPLRWTKPRRVFVNSMSDLFHRDVPFDFIDRVFAVMALTPQHTYQILTKRPERMAEYATKRGEGPYSRGADPIRDSINRDFTGRGDHRGALHWPLPNVWLGTSVENQQTADERIPHLLKCPAAVRFLSMEPLLGPVDLAAIPELVDQVIFSMNVLTGEAIEDPCECGCGGYWGGKAESDRGRYSGGHRVDWCIVGGESGPQARPMHPQWARSIRDQCQAAGVPFFFKQWGEYSPHETCDGTAWCTAFADGRVKPATDYEGRASILNRDVANGAWPMARVGKKAAGRLLDGREYNDMPEVSHA